MFLSSRCAPTPTAMYAFFARAVYFSLSLCIACFGSWSGHTPIDIDYSRKVDSVFCLSHGKQFDSVYWRVGTFVNILAGQLADSFSVRRWNAFGGRVLSDGCILRLLYQDASIYFRKN